MAKDTLSVTECTVLNYSSDVRISAYRSAKTAHKKMISELPGTKTRVRLIDGAWVKRAPEGRTRPHEHSDDYAKRSLSSKTETDSD
jgi:hypothetical protein